MSIKCLSRVWEYSQHKGGALLLLLSIADYAKDSGYAWPSIITLAKKTRLSTRQVMRLIKQVEESGELTVLRDKHNNRYIVNVWPPEGPNGIDICVECGDMHIEGLSDCFHRHHIIPRSKGGTEDPNNIELLCPPCHQIRHGNTKGDIMSRDIDVTSKGDAHVTKKVTPTSHEPSINHHNKPSLINAIAMWKSLFPDKPQPRPTTGTIKTKWKNRIKDKHFVENYHHALQMASLNGGLVEKSWFNFRWVIHNDINYQKLIDDEFAWMNKGKPTKSTKQSLKEDGWNVRS